MNQFWRIVRFAKPYWKTLLTISFSIFIVAGLNQVGPFINQGIVDSIAGIIRQRNVFIPQNVINLLAVFLGVKIIRKIFERISWYYTNLFTYRFRFRLREIGFDHLMKLSVSFFDEKISGELMSELDRGTTQLTQIVNNSGMFFIPSLVTAIIGIFVVFHFYWPLGVFVLSIFVPYTLISLWRFKKNQKLEKKEYKLYDTQYGHFWEAISSVRLIKSFLAENFELRRLKDFNQKIYNLRKTIEINWNKSTIADILVESWVWGIYVWVVLLTFKGNFSLGTMVLLITYIDLIRWPLWEMNWFFWETKRAQIGARDFFKILDTAPEIQDSKKLIKFTDTKGRINFINISFSYKQEKEVLKNINLTIEPSQTVAFVGPSGSGKTTIVSLISRFYDLTKGTILIDGIDIKKIRQSDLRKNIGWVTQEPYLFAETIVENLRYGKGTATRKEIELACRIAHAHDFIKGLPKGYETKIGEKGVQLSGGQRQRLALARVILKNPPILILDEATSALDSASEMLIGQALEKITKERTTIIIAHRLSTARKASKIFVLNKGELVEFGSHQELMKKKKGLYASLFKIQTGKIDKLKEWDMVA